MTVYFIAFLLLSLFSLSPGATSPISMSSSEATSDSLSRSTTPPERHVIVIPVEEQVDFGMHAFLKRAVDEALLQKPDVLVFQVNTFGGELGAAFDIVDLISGIKDCSTYVYVEKKAISAGALISLSCNRMVMGQSTTLGDCAPITQTQEGIQMLGEKIQSPLRAKFRNLAERNGYPSLLSQAMVSIDMGVIMAHLADTTLPPDFYTGKEWETLNEKAKAKYASHKFVVQEGELLTLTDLEAHHYGFSQGSYASLEAFLAEKKWKRIATFATTWSEDMVRFIGSIAPILMMLGFGALYLEFKTPGLSIFGILGFVLLAIVFGSKYAVGLAHHTELLLLILGFSLFMAEMWFFPGTFLLAGIGILIMIAALVMSLQGFALPNPEMPWEMESMVKNLTLTMSMAVIALIIPIVTARWILTRLPGQWQVASDVTLAGSSSVSEQTLALQIGQTGITRTGLRPTGKVDFNGKTYEAQSRGEFIEPGITVSIARIVGNNITVKPHSGQETT